VQLDAAVIIVGALADGVDPMTGTPFPAESVLLRPQVAGALDAARAAMKRELERAAHVRPFPKNFGRPWSDDEVANLVTLYEDEKLSIPELARRLERTGSSIRLKLEKLGKLKPGVAA
jgi:hypothetical protein